MNFLVDAQLPPALARWFVERGFKASHVFDLGLERADDRRIWDRALSEGAAVVTKDEGFAARRMVEPQGPQIVWVRFGNASRRETLARVDALLPQIREALERGERIVEIV